MPRIPENLNFLHSGEETLRAKSIEVIEANADLSKHVVVIEKAMDILNFFSMNPDPAEDDDMKTLRLLGMRLFNGCAAAYSLTVSGYYQVAAMVMRDLLETAFLLNFFRHDRTKISEWRTADDRTRKTKFSPVKVRTLLDEKDGFTGRKREAAYSLLCELASHPTYKGFRMLLPTGHNHHCGPFHDAASLKALIEELVKIAIQGGEVFSHLFRADTKEKLATKLFFIEASGEWFEEYFGRAFNREEVQRLKKLLSKL